MSLIFYLYKNLPLAHSNTKSILSASNSTQNTKFAISDPKKFNCTVLELLKIVQQCEQILENESICGSDWTNQMKKRWYTEKMPFWVIVNADLQFLNGSYENCYFDLARLDGMLEGNKYFGNENVKRAL